MVKLGNAWEVKQVVPAWPAVRGQVYQAVLEACVVYNLVWREI